MLQIQCSNFEVTSDCLILVSLLLGLAFDRVDTDLFIVLLESSQIFASLGELSLLHTLSDIPVDEGTLRVHQIELVVETSPSLGDGGGVAQHTDSTLDLGEIAAGYNSWRLVVDADLEASWAPVDELDGALGLDGSDGGVDILGHDVTTVQHTAGHVLAVAGIALHHLVGGLEASVGDLGHAELLVVGLLSRDDRCVGNQREVDARVGYQVGLEFCQIDVECTIEAEGGGDGGHDLTDETVQVGVGWPLDVQVATADVIDGFIVDHEGAVRVLQGCVGGEDGVVWLDDGGGDLGSGVDGELELGLLSVVDGQTLHEE